MKAWKKGAIVGAVWGIISGVMWLGASMGGPRPTIWHKIILFPGYFGYTFFRALGGILKERAYLIPGSVQLFTFISLPILTGVLIGIIITYIIGLLEAK